MYFRYLNNITNTCRKVFVYFRYLNNIRNTYKYSCIFGIWIILRILVGRYLCILVIWIILRILRRKYSCILGIWIILRILIRKYSCTFGIRITGVDVIFNKTICHRLIGAKENLFSFFINIEPCWNIVIGLVMFFDWPIQILCNILKKSKIWNGTVNLKNSIYGVYYEYHRYSIIAPNIWVV